MVATKFAIIRSQNTLQPNVVTMFAYYQTIMSSSTHVRDMRQFDNWNCIWEKTVQEDFTYSPCPPPHRFDTSGKVV